MRARLLVAATLLAVALPLHAYAASAPAAVSSQALAPLRIAVADSDIAKGAPFTTSAALSNRYGYTRNALLTRFASADIATISDADLRSLDTLRGYDVVVLTRQVAMDAAQRVALREYVAGGGGVVAMFGAGRWDYNSWRNVADTGHYYPAIKMFGANVWEWGELSEAYQVEFNNDPIMQTPYTLYSPDVSTSPILEAVDADTGRGTAPLALIARRSDANEMVWALRGNADVTPLLLYDLRHNSPASDDRYSGTMAGWSSTYHMGRVVYFGFQLYDVAKLGWGTNDAASQQQAIALLCESVRWAGTGGTYGPATKAPVVSGSASYSAGLLHVHGSVVDRGPVQLRGLLTLTLIDPKGVTRGRATVKGHAIPLAPGHGASGSMSVKVGMRPVAGTWTARVGYSYYDYMRGGDVTAFYTTRLATSGRGMRRTGGGASWSRTAAPAGPRIDGPDRYAVAASIAATGWPGGAGSSGAVVLASGRDFSGALSASALAGKLDAPVLLTQPNALPAVTAARLRALFAGRSAAVIYAVGGTRAIPESVVAAADRVVDGALAAGGHTAVHRIGANDGFELAAQVARSVGTPASGPLAGTVIIASDAAHADALSIAPLAAKGIPVLFVTSSEVPLATQQALADLGVRHCLIVGGPASVGPVVQSWLESHGYRQAGIADNDMSSPDTRLTGPTRYDVSREAVLYEVAVGGFGTSRVLVASGLVWPDALTAGPYAARSSSPVLLVHGHDVDSSLTSVLWFVTRRADPPSVTFLGGPGTVSDLTRGKIARFLGSR